jgi:hypothetical protein
MMRALPRTLLPVLLALLAGPGTSGCSDTPGRPAEVESFRVTILGQPDLGTSEKPLPFAVKEEDALALEVDIEALRHGQLDPSYEGWAAITARPICGRFEEQVQVFPKFTAGVARKVPIKIWAASGEVRVLARDVGYVQAQDVATAQCNNKIDDDGDGYIDMQDRGCLIGGDDSEGGGTGATGASGPIYVANPKMELVQRPISGEVSPLEKCRVTVDRGWLLVTRVGTDGLYVSDFEGVSWDGAKWDFKSEDLAYDSVFAYNYTTPLNLQEGDCLTQMDGSVDEFYGFTELGKPTWKKGDWTFCASKARLAGLSDCPTGAADGETPAGKLCRQRVDELVNTPLDLTTLVLKDSDGNDTSVWDRNKNLAEGFEAGLVQLTDVTLFKELRHCDYNGNGVVDFGIQEEKDCSNDCGDDAGCVVFETYNRYFQWSVSFTDGLGATREISVVTAGSIQDFDPVKASDAANKSGTPKKLSKVVGTLRHLVFGRPPWILETRRPGDCPDCVNQ